MVTQLDQAEKDELQFQMAVTFSISIFYQTLLKPECVLVVAVASENKTHVQVDSNPKKLIKSR